MAKIGEINFMDLFFILHIYVIFVFFIMSSYAFIIRILSIFKKTHVLFKTHKKVNEIQKTVSKNCQV